MVFSADLDKELTEGLFWSIDEAQGVLALKNGQSKKASESFAVVVTGNGMADICLVDADGIPTDFVWHFIVDVEPRMISLLYEGEKISGLNPQEGDEMILSVQLLPEIVDDSYYASVEWRTDDPEIVKVTSSGRDATVEFLRAGATNVRAVLEQQNISSNPIPVIVESKDKVTEVKCTVKDVLVEGEILEPDVKVKTEKNARWHKPEKNVGWDFQRPYLSLDEAGEIVAQSVGKATIRAVVGGVFSEERTVEIVPVVAIVNPPSEVEVNKPVLLSAKVNPADADQAVEWHIIGTSSATIDSASGVLVCKSVGERVMVEAVNKRGKAVVDIMTVEVREILVEQVRILRAPIRIDPCGKPIQLQVEVLPGTAQDKGIQWSSSDTTVVTVSEDGLLKGVTEGKAVISAVSTRVPSCNDSFEVQSRIEVKSVEIKVTGSYASVGGKRYVKIGDILQSRCTVSPALPAGEKIEWSVSNADVKQSADRTTIHFNRTGKASVSAKVQDVKSDNILFEVLEVPESLTVSDKKVKEGDTIKIAATFKEKEVGTVKYSWKFQDAGSGKWQDFTGDGKDTSEIRFVADMKSDGRRFKCVAVNEVGSKESNVATVAVIPTAPSMGESIIVEKTIASISEPIKLSASLNDTTATILWYYRKWDEASWTAIPNPTNSLTLEFNPGVPGEYCCKCSASNISGLDEATSVKLTFVRRTLTEKEKDKLIEIGKDMLTEIKEAKSKPEEELEVTTEKIGKELSDLLSGLIKDGFFKKKK